MDNVHCGWLTKSPPENRMKGPFKSQWRRRYFVLYAPPRTDSAFLSSSHSAFLHYYDNEKITKKKGSIDLENCEELRDRLDHNCYPYLFSLRTWDHGNLRTYFLAADNEAEMDKWVDKLAWVLNFSNGPMQAPVLMSPTPLNVVESASNLQPDQSVANLRKTHGGEVGVNSDIAAIQSLPSRSQTVSRPVGSATRSSGSYTDNLTLVSTPAGDNERPPLMPKLREQIQPHSSDGDSDNDDEEMYNYPSPNFYKPQTTHQEETYDVPTRLAQPVADSYKDTYYLPPVSRRNEAKGLNNDNNDGDIYDLPPVSHGNEAKGLHNDNDDADIYDLPPVSRGNEAKDLNSDNGDADTYDLPPVSHRNEAKGLNNDDDADTYDLPPVSRGNEEKDLSDDDDDEYDVPPPVSTNVVNNGPPPANHGRAAHHSYVNIQEDETELKSSKTKCEHRLTSDSNINDSAEGYEVVASSRTRSWKSSSFRTQVVTRSEEVVKLPLKNRLTEVDTTDDDDDDKDED